MSQSSQKKDGSRLENFWQQWQAFWSTPGRIDRWLHTSVIVVGLGGALFGLGYINQHLRDPYVLPESTTSKLSAQTAPQDLLGLKGRDTDGDNLSDYDELEMYKTSPYLEDSDSDGLADGLELARQSDPLCPAGQNCFNRGLYQDADAAPIDSGLTISQAQSANDLRAILIQSGMDPELLADLTDEELVQAYAEASQALGGSGAAAAPSASTDVSAALSELSASDLRQLLLEAGVPASTVNQLSDQQLVDLANQTLNELQ